MNQMNPMHLNINRPTSNNIYALHNHSHDEFVTKTVLDMELQTIREKLEKYNGWGYLTIQMIISVLFQVLVIYLYLKINKL